MSASSPSGRSTSAVFEASEATNSGSFGSLEWLLFLSVSAIWGSSFLLIAEGLEALTPGLVTLGRVGMGAMALGLLRLLRPADVTPIAPEDRRTVFLLSVLWVALPFTLFPLSQQWITSALAGLLNGATPIFAAVVSAVLVKTRPNSNQLIGIAVGFVGVILISLPSLGEGGSEARGVLMVVAATLCYGFAINMASPLQARYGATTLMSAVLGLATVWTIPFGLWNFGDNEWQLQPIIAVAFLGAVGTGGAYWIMATLVGRIGPIRGSFITYLIPVVALALGVTFRNDEVALLAVVGAVVTISGALMASRR